MVLERSTRGDKHALALCNITRSELYAERNALHLILGKLPAGGILGIVELYTEASREAVGKCTGSVEHAPPCASERG